MWKKFRNTNYEVNQNGEVRHINKKTIRKPYKGEYLRISLYENGKQFTKNIHEIVAELYLNKIENTNCINHKDGNKYNNNIDNLEYTTYSKNLKHGYNTGLINAVGINNGRSKLTEKEVLEIRNLKSSKTYKELSLMYNVSFSTIKDIISKRNWKHI
jgi:hypothetical protein